MDTDNSHNKFKFSNGKKIIFNNNDVVIASRYEKIQN